jgi:hypothetical protein
MPATQGDSDSDEDMGFGLFGKDETSRKKKDGGKKSAASTSKPTSDGSGTSSASPVLSDESEPKKTGGEPREIDENTLVGIYQREHFTRVFVGAAPKRHCILRNLGDDIISDRNVTTVQGIKTVSGLLYMDLVVAHGGSPFPVELPVKWFWEMTGPTHEQDPYYMNQKDAGARVVDVLTKSLKGGKAENDIAITPAFRDMVRKGFTGIMALEKDDRTVEGEELKVMTVPTEEKDWQTIEVSEETARTFFIMIGHGKVEFVSDEMTGWVKEATFNMWYSICFQGHFSITKFNKFIQQCGTKVTGIRPSGDPSFYPTIYQRTVANWDRADYVNLFEYVTGELPPDVLGFTNIFMQSRYFGMTSIVTILDQMKAHPNFEWPYLATLFGAEFAAFQDALQTLTGSDWVLNPYGGFGSMAEKNKVSARKFSKLATIAFRVATEVDGNTTLKGSATFNSGSNLGSHKPIVDKIITAYIEERNKGTEKREDRDKKVDKSYRTLFRAITRISTD